LRFPQYEAGKELACTTEITFPSGLQTRLNKANELDNHHQKFPPDSFVVDNSNADGRDGPDVHDEDGPEVNDEGGTDVKFQHGARLLMTWTSPSFSSSSNQDTICRYPAP